MHQLQYRQKERAWKPLATLIQVSRGNLKKLNLVSGKFKTIEQHCQDHFYSLFERLQELDCTLRDLNAARTMLR